MQAAPKIASSYTAEPLSMNDLPGPRGLPLLGNVLQLHPLRLHRVIERWSKRYGPIFKIRVGKAPIVIITSPDAIEFVLKNRPGKFRRMSKMDEVIREMGVFGVFNAEGEEWKQQRKLVSQALNTTHVKNFYPLLNQMTGKLYQRWQTLADRQSPVSIKAELMRYAVDITSKLAFGVDMNMIGQATNPIQEHFEVIFPAIFRRTNAPIPYWRYLTLPADKKLAGSIAAINSLMQGIIDQKRAAMDDPANQGVPPANLLESLIAGSTADSPVPNEVIIGNVLTMLLAGEDTTAHSMTWIVYFIDKHPAVQRKMQEEADRVLGTATTLARYEDANLLPYIEAVALEAMRLKPVAPVLFHNALEDVVIEGVLIKKGTGVFPQTQAAAIDDSHFSNAGEFVPERWLNAGCPAHRNHNEKAFLPFGSGPRFCPGYNLAMVEIKAVLAMICRNFTVTIVSEQPVKDKLAFTMMPGEFEVRFQPRN